MLSNVASKKYGNLGKLIDMEEYYIPCLEFSDYDAMRLSEAQAERLEFEELKEHSKKLTKMEDDRPKLYGLIMQHMSVESKDEKLLKNLTMKIGIGRRIQRNYGKP